MNAPKNPRLTGIAILASGSIAEVAPNGDVTGIYRDEDCTVLVCRLCVDTHGPGSCPEF